MDKNLLKVATDKFVRFCKDNGYGLLRLTHTMERVDEEEMPLEDVDKELFALFMKFGEAFENPTDAGEFLAEFTLPKHRYFHSVSACLEYIAEHESLCGGDKIELCKKDCDDDTIVAVIITTECDSLLNDFIILND